MDHPDFHQVVSTAWGEVSPSGDAMHVLRSKLKHLRQRLRIWNREQFELVHERVNLAKQKLDDIQKDLDLHGASEVRL